MIVAPAAHPRTSSAPPTQGSCGRALRLNVLIDAPTFRFPSPRYDCPPGGTTVNPENKKSQLASRLIAALILVSGAILVLSLSTRFSSAQSGDPAPFSHALPPLDGSHLRAIVVEVNYAPGEADKPHSHPCTVIGYVAQGAIRFQVKGGGERLQGWRKLLRAAKWCPPGVCQRQRQGTRPAGRIFRLRP
jgi:hypothetical protein